MQRKLKSILWGLFFIGLGVAVTMKALDLMPYWDELFLGWWTLFLIVPGLIDLVTERNKTGAVILLLIGVGLLLAERDVISYGELWKLILPAVLIIIGVHMVFRAFVEKKQAPPPSRENKEASFEDQTPPASDGKTEAPNQEYTTVFSSDDIHFNGQVFDGTKLTTAFGGIECNLSGAIINKNITIEASAIFGGIEITLPRNVRLHIESSSAFLGGVDNHFIPSNDPSAPVVTIRPTAIFGGVEIK